MFSLGSRRCRGRAAGKHAQSGDFARTDAHARGTRPRTKTPIIDVDVVLRSIGSGLWGICRGGRTITLEATKGVGETVGGGKRIFSLARNEEAAMVEPPPLPGITMECGRAGGGGGEVPET